MSDELQTQLEQLRERGDQLAVVLGGMVEGVIAVDRQAKVMFANRAAGRLFDFRSEQARGRPLLTLVRDETLHQAFRRAIDSGEVVNAEIQRFSPARSALAVHATPLSGSPCPGVVLVLYDLTQLRRLESIREEFVANVSHELKTPLSSIKAYAETLRTGAINDQDHNLEFVKRIEDQAERLHQLILDLIRLARIESGEEAYEVANVDVQEAVTGCLAEYGPAAAARQIELIADPPEESLVIRADDEALRQILDNLLSNALKYVPERGRVTVRWRRQQSDVLIEVIDTGIGIEDVHLDRIFERFYRVDKARSRELGGTGLGLSIVKHLAQFFGGSVGVSSRVGQGSTFWVKLPLADETADANV
jgi:two-component system phosphate regulon sensor histidine kinase PhoR